MPNKCVDCITEVITFYKVYKNGIRSSTKRGKLYFQTDTIYFAVHTFDKCSHK